MGELPAVRRMRRFQAESGTEYDEALDGRLRRVLKARDKSPIPPLESVEVVEAREGPLVEVDPAALQRQARKGTRWRRGCTDCGKTSYWGECTPGRRKGQRR